MHRTETKGESLGSMAAATKRQDMIAVHATMEP